MLDRVKKTSSDINLWIRSAARAINSILERIDGNQATVAADYTSQEYDRYIFVSDTSVARTITLLQKAPENHTVTVKDTSGGAGTNNITVQRGGTDTVDGGTNATISSNYGVLTLVSDGGGGWWTT